MLDKISIALRRYRMFNFRSFLSEKAEEAKPLKHLTHLEDNVIHGGHEGVAIADQHLADTAKALEGKKSPIHISTKFDGAPSIVFGTHPTTGQFFVGTKSVFNKNPKINYTPEDIDANHGHAPGLASKLKQALEHLPKITPREGGVYQGDLMHTPEDIETKNGMHHFTPNTITYSVPADSAHGRAIDNSKLGIVVHTRYGGAKNLEGMSAGPLDQKTRQKFESHPDVHNIDPTIHINPSNFTPEERAEFAKHKEAARQSYSKMAPEAEDALAGHGINLEAHINRMVREGGKPTVDGYIGDLTAKANKAIDSVKTQKAKDRKAQEHSDTVNHIEKNRKHFERALDLHGHLQRAKDVLTNVMAKNNPFSHSIAGEATGPEGAVAVDKNGNMSKFVDRAEFSRQNFLKSKMGGDRSTQPVNESLGSTTSKEHQPLHHSFRRSVHIEPRVGEKQIPIRTSVAAARNQHQQFAARSRNQVAVREESEGVNLVHHTTWMRGNPIHGGHEAVINQVSNGAAQDKGSHSVVMTGSQDAKKNPLSPDQKLKHARRAFPGVNVEIADKASPTLLHHASNLYDKGVRELNVHVGSDRVKEFDGLLNRYKGVKSKHGYYGNDMKINVIPVGGDRAGASSGIDSYSATKMRQAAQNNDRDSFHKMAPSAMSEKEKDEMMQDVQNGMRG